jgi:hypothetical protein
MQTLAEDVTLQLDDAVATELAEAFALRMEHEAFAVAADARWRAAATRANNTMRRYEADLATFEERTTAQRFADARQHEKCEAESLARRAATRFQELWDEVIAPYRNVQHGGMSHDPLSGCVRIMKTPAPPEEEKKLCVV